MKTVPGLDLPFTEPLDCDHTILVDKLSPQEILNKVKKLISF